MSPLGPVTEAERRGWQLRDAATLMDLLMAAHRAQLPPLAWRLGPLGGLVGVCLAGDPAVRRADFQTWTAFLGDGVQVWPQRLGGSTLHLHAVHKRYGPRGTTVTVTADIHPIEPDEGSPSPSDPVQGGPA